MAKAPKKQKLVLASPPAASVVKLDLGGGQSPKEGFASVDLNAPNPAHRVDLFKFPWPFADNSVEELHASHFIEHIPLRDVEEKDISIASVEDIKKSGSMKSLGGMAASAISATLANRAAAIEEFVGKDMLFAFFDECYRILKPGGDLTCIWPSLRSNRAFQDPTHRRFIPLEMLMYLDPGWRKANKLDHYRVNCHFQGNGNFSMLQEETAYTAEVQNRRFNNFWNTILDFHAVMKAIK